MRFLFFYTVRKKYAQYQYRLNLSTNKCQFFKITFLIIKILKKKSI